MAITDSQVEMNRRLYSGQQVGLMGVPIGKPTSPSPIRTRREIVDGTYGIASISTYDETRCRIGLEKNILTAEDFRELAHLANQLAEVLEENQ